MIKIEDLHYTYPNGVKALNGVSLEVKEGESIGIIGPNASGKSTLLLHLNGILQGEGKVRVFGLEPKKENLKKIRSRIGMVFQDPDDQLFSPTVFDDVAFGPVNMGLRKEEVARRVEEALDDVGMAGSEKKSPQHLSLGEKKRVSVATVLSMRPDLLVLDEPTSNLDPRARGETIALLKRMDKTKIIATHDLQMVGELCARIAVMHKGKIVADRKEILKDRDLLRNYGLV
jgi:cobalt transport protein ATP-binding subunit